MDHETNGQRARFERWIAEMIYVIASGEKIDSDRTERFGALLEKIYENPFDKKKKPMTAGEIKDYVLDKISKLRKKLKKE